MFIAALLTRVKKWKQPKCPLTDEWYTNVIYPYNGILFSNNKEELTQATTWMNFENTLLSETIHLQKVTHGRIPLI